MKKDFRYVITAGPDVNPANVRAKLVELLGVDKNSFDDITDNFLASVYAVSPIPVEVAMTMPEREKLMSVHPECRFIITGIPETSINMLKEHGYEVFEMPKVEKKPVEQKSTSAVAKVIYNGKEYEVKDPEKVAKIAATVEAEINKNFNRFFEELDKINEPFASVFRF